MRILQSPLNKIPLVEIGLYQQTLFNTASEIASSQSRVVGQFSFKQYKHRVGRIWSPFPCCIIPFHWLQLEHKYQEKGEQLKSSEKTISQLKQELSIKDLAVIEVKQVFPGDFMIKLSVTHI